jgi:hypothetical protein
MANRAAILRRRGRLLCNAFPAGILAELADPPR